MARRNKKPKSRTDGSNSRGNRQARWKDRKGQETGTNSNVPAARNDLSWYSRYPDLLVAAGQLQYPYRPGMAIPFGRFQFAVSDSQTQFSDEVASVIPGVAVLDWCPSIGYSQTNTDPASVTAREIYAKVRKVYSGDLEADAPDFMMYLLALDSVFSYIAWLKRLYRILTAYSPNNFVTPDTLLGAMRLTQQEISNLRQDKVKLWGYINTLVYQSRKFTCPSSFDFMNRHYWMSDNVYTDAASINSQFYMFNLVGVYQYALLPVADGSGNTAAGVQMVSLPTAKGNRSTSPITVDTLYTFGLNLLQTLASWGTAYTINGYLQRAFEGEPSFMVDLLPQDEPFAPVYEEEVLVQIENSRTFGFAGITPSTEESKNGYQVYPFISSATEATVSNFNYYLLNVTQDPLTNSVISTPTILSLPNAGVSTYKELTFGSNGSWLSIRSDAPTVADNVIATRLNVGVAKVSRSATSSSERLTAQLDTGTELPIAWRVVKYAPGADYLNTDTFVPAVAILPEVTNSGTGATVSNLFETASVYARLLEFEAFDWHPLTLVATYRIPTNNSTAYIMSAVFAGDAHNSSVVTSAQLEQLHRVCVFSEFNTFGIS